MLYYTLRNPSGKIDATYSGRFAFIHFNKREELDTAQALRAEDDMNALWNAGHDEASSSAIRHLAHEYTHKHIFALSGSGLELNSIRFWVRLNFLISGNMQTVSQYYRMRTIYFMETRPYHEKLASEIDKERKEKKTEIEDAFSRNIQLHYDTTIAKAESTIRKKWEAQRLSPPKATVKLHRLYGKWLQENFAVKLSCREGDKSWHHSSFADKGITNDAYTVRPDESPYSKLMKRIMFHTLVHPITRLENFNKLFEWYWLGQRAQFLTMTELYGIDSSTFWTQYLHPTAMFIMQWAGVPLKHHSALIECYEDTLMLEKYEFMNRWQNQLREWEGDPDICRYFSFFYQHGN